MDSFQLSVVGCRLREAFDKALPIDDRQPFIVKSENKFTLRQGTNPYRRWRGLYPRPCVGV